MVNVGSVLSNLLFSWSWFSGSLLVSQRATFGLIAVLVSALTAVTLLTTRELAARSTVGPDADAAVSPLLEDVGYGSDSSRHSSPTTKWRHQTAWHLLSLRDGLSTACWTDRTGLAAASDRMARLLLLTPLTALCRVILWPYSIFRRIHRSPMVLRRLFIVDLLSWMALLSFYMFLTDYLGQAAGGRAEDPDGSEGRAKFDEGVRMGSKCLMIDGVSGGLFSLFGLMPMTRRLGTRNTYVLCLTVFSSCMVVISLAPSPPLIYVLCAVMGCGYSVMGTTPSSLLTLYHYQPQIFFSDQPAPREAAGLGENFAILDTSYCLGSILPSLTLGWLVDMYGMPHLYVMIGGLFGFLSAGIATTLIYRAEEMVPRTKSPVPATR
ncbi:solute carrier family 45 member 3-like [Pollicipes pollicipes]|uniref:solute carrier family 45 member 3-like n=1 Tax=Pollicipes pollicipes TaxID=41117 RepID=UPI00188573C3|nr:solute carrier family 45 member 3-like [Pollicipes pollicipes]